MVNYKAYRDLIPRSRNSENRGYPKSWRFRFGAYCQTGLPFW
jgi:hypothetical protein